MDVHGFDVGQVFGMGVDQPPYALDKPPRTVDAFLRPLHITFGR